MEYGIIILKNGYTLDDVHDPRSWALNTKYPALKVATKGSGSIVATPPSFDGLVEIRHDLGYPPENLVYSEIYPNTGEYRRITGDMASGMGYVYNRPVVDPNVVYYMRPFADGEKYFYYIFYDEL